MNKKILIFTFLFVLIFISFTSAAETCQKGYVLNSLRKALYIYYVNPEESAKQITLAELKELLALYIKFEGVGEEFSCELTEKSLADKAYNLEDKIPSCSDGTKYGKCNLNNKPMYCYAGRLVPRCKLCGCPEGEWCDETYVHEEKGNKGQWGKCYPLDNVTNVTFGLALRIADCATINTDCESGTWYEGIERYGCALEGATVRLEALNHWNSYSAQLIVNSGEHSNVGDAPAGRSEWIIFKSIPVWTGARNYNANEGFYRITVTKDGYTSKTGLIGIFGTTGSDLYWSREFIGNYICLNAVQQPQTCTPEEQLIVDFRSLSGTTTTNQYSGIVDISVVGTGQSSGIAYNDAFYVFTSYLNGQPITPKTQTPFMLYVDDNPVVNVTSTPSYNSQHSYKFTYDAGTTPRKIKFRIGDTYVPDNSGSFTIGICEDAVGKCLDGTAYGQCTATKPKYCQDGGLVNKCQTCGCPTGQICQADGACCESSKTDLVMHLPFDDEVFGVAQDFSGNNNSGILYGPPSETTGKVGKALNFDGNDDYVVVADSCTLDITNAITLEAWIKFNQLPPDIDGKDWYAIILKSKRTESYGLMYGGQYVGNRLRFYHKGLNADRTDAHVPGLLANKWYHVIATYDGSTTKIYLNGEETEYIDRASEIVTGTINTTNYGLFIGREDPERPALPNWYYPFNGIIDEVKIWNRALSAEEACEEAGKTWQDGSCGTPEPCVTPTSGMTITKDTTLCPGTYELSPGIKIGSPGNIVLDCNGAVLIGTYTHPVFGTPCQYGSIGVQLIGANNTIVKNCVLKNHFQGIVTLGSKNNQIINNTLSEDCVGMLLIWDSDQNIVNNNRIINPRKEGGIYVNGSGNKIYNNYLSNNPRGVAFANDNNLAYHNNFIASNPSDEGINNQWDYNQEGNYWSDYNGTDANCDGIGDVPYYKDNYPFMEMDGWLKTYTPC